MSLLDQFSLKAKRLWNQFSPSIQIPTGLHSFKLQENGSISRIHLRIEENYSGLMFVDANRVYHLNATSTVMAYLLLKKCPFPAAINTLLDNFQTSRKQAEIDYLHFASNFHRLYARDGSCPVCDLNLETDLPFSAKLSAPYRMDLAITYRCNNRCHHCYNEKRQSKELSRTQWRSILDHLWQIGIPHIVFTGGEPTLSKQLPGLIAHAENNGQVTGLNTNGRLLNQMDYVQTLVKAGLDHIQITLESHIPEIHDRMVNMPGAWKETVSGIRNAVYSGLFVMTNTTLLDINSPHLADTLAFLADLGVKTVGLNALIYSGKGISVGNGLKEEQLVSLLNLAREKTDQHHQRLIWYTPTQYCHFDPVQLELGVKGCTAALYNMCIEPDGNVIPCQSYYVPLGNILNNPWENIWNHPLAITLRERKNVPQECRKCSLLIECGGGCPLAAQAGQLSQPRRVVPNEP